MEGMTPPARRRPDSTSVWIAAVASKEKSAPLGAPNGHRDPGTGRHSISLRRDADHVAGTEAGQRVTVFFGDHQRHDPHSDQVGTVNSLVAGSQHRSDTQQALDLRGPVP